MGENRKEEFFFTSVIGETGWYEVINKCYEILEKAANSTTGLIPVGIKLMGAR